MASEKVKLIGAVEMEYAATSQGTLRVKTDLPGNAMVERISPLAIPATSTRRQVRFRVPGPTKGHLLQLSYAPGAGTARLYQVRVWARELPTGAWAWYPVYVPETSDAWQPIQLPIPVTGEAWESVQLPIPPTSEQWASVQLPIPPTSEEWNTLQLPIKGTPLVPEWVNVEIDR
jgi:hypothetical protein